MIMLPAFIEIWKSILSGIKSSVGVNSKTQKEIIKKAKTQKK